MKGAHEENTFQSNVEGLQKLSRAHHNFNKLLLFSRFVVLLQIVIANILMLKWMPWNGNENVSMGKHGEQLASFTYKIKYSSNSVNFKCPKHDERKSFVKSSSPAESLIKHYLLHFAMSITLPCLINCMSRLGWVGETCIIFQPFLDQTLISYIS